MFWYNLENYKQVFAIFLWHIVNHKLNCKIFHKHTMGKLSRVLFHRTLLNLLYAGFLSHPSRGTLQIIFSYLESV